MTVFDKLQEVLASAKEGRILLFREGMFWKAYQEAAYLFVTNLKLYQVNKNYVKKVGMDVFSLGFPVPSTAKILSGVSYKEDRERIWIPLNFPFDEADYVRWRESVNVQPTVSHKPASDTLLVYKHAYDLVLYFYNVNRNVEREFKFSLSEKIKEELHEVLMNICFANEEVSKERKLQLVGQANNVLASAKIRIRLLHDLKQLPLKHYAAFAEKITDLSSELNKWKEAI
jgi:hypothetical protein